MNRLLATAEDDHAYAPLPAGDHEAGDEDHTTAGQESPAGATDAPFSWFGYWAFVWMGMYMLWSW